jgi:hypothetical protein
MIAKDLAPEMGIKAFAIMEEVDGPGPPRGRTPGLEVPALGSPASEQYWRAAAGVTDT